MDDKSIETRQLLVAKLFFQTESQKKDLLNPSITQTELIARLMHLINEGYYFEITRVQSDHHDDCEGHGCHHAGWAVDCWPLITAKAGDYLDASTGAFRAFLAACAKVPYLMQIGLGGSAWSTANVEATGLSLNDASVFEDDGQDHVHLGVRPL